MKQLPVVPEPVSAEERYREAWKRLCDGKPAVMPVGTAPTKGNVEREAGRTPGALKTARFPTLAAAIAARMELHTPAAASEKRSSQKGRATKRTDKQTKEDAVRQRDIAHSLLASASRRILELTEEVQLLQQQLDKLNPAPLSLRLARSADCSPWE